MPVWRPTPKPVPTWLNFSRSHLLEYQKNWVTVVDNDVNLGYGCLYLLRNRGLLWRNFQTETEKYVAFVNMQSYRIVRDITKKERCFLVETSGPIITTYEKDNGNPECDQQQATNGNGAGATSDVSEGDFLRGSSVSVQFILENECDLRELFWYVNTHWCLWAREGGEMRPSDEELYAPGQFDDPVFPKRIDWNGKRKKQEDRAWAKYEARIKKFGPPTPCNEGLTGRHLMSHDFSVKQFSRRVYGGGGMQAIVDFYNSLPPGGYWWGPRKDVEDEDAVDPARYADPACHTRSNG